MNTRQASPQTTPAARLADLMSRQLWSEAEALADALIASTPEDAWLHHQRGLAVWKQGRPDDAAAAFAQALQLPGTHAELLSDYSLLLADQGGPPGSVAVCRAAVAAHPGRADLLNNLGIVLLSDGALQESLACFNEAVRMAPGSATNTYNRGFARLLLGDLKGWFADNEARFAGSGLWPKGTAKLDELPLWMGEPLAGMNLLVHAEQGFGDTLQYIRYIALLAALKPARLTVHVQPEVLPALGCLRRFAELHPIGTVIGPCHFSIPLLSVPHRLGTDWQTLPAWSPYLAPEADRVDYWRARLAQAEAASAGEPPVLRIGLVWRGSAANARDRERSMALRELHLLAQPGVRFVSLQKGPAAQEARDDAVLRPLPLGEELVDFGDTAALISLLDLVITVDTAVAHLSGALGHPTWLMLTRVDPRWLVAREDSPWYPTLRLFRQQQRGDWRPAVREVAYALQQRLQQRRRADGDAGLADALHSARQALAQGAPSQALEISRSASDQWPGAAAAWHALACAEEAAGQAEAALGHARTAVSWAPHAVEGQVLLGRLQRSQRRPLEALCSLQRALALAPEDLEALREMARLLEQQGRAGEACACWMRVLSQAPGAADDLAALARASLAANDPLSALRRVQEALAIAPDRAEWQPLSRHCLALLTQALPRLQAPVSAWLAQEGPGQAFALAEALFETGLPRPAIGFYRRVLANTTVEAASLHHPALRSLSDALVAEADWPAVCALGELSAARFPDDLDLRSDHATALWKRGQLAEAEQLFAAILAQSPDHPAALLHGSAVALALGSGERARARAERALQQDPGRIECLLARAAVAEWQGADEEADRDLLRVLAVDPQHAQARFNRGTIALRAGAWPEGWRDYECRADAEGVRHWLGSRAQDAVRWHGEDLRGRHLVVCCEQGLGDTLQTLRCLPLLRDAQPARITLQVQLELLSWLRTLPPPFPGVLFEVMPRGLPVPPFDVFVPLLSLPGLLGLQPGRVPAPWLPPVDAARREFWQARGGRPGSLRVGLCWAGNPAFPRDAERSPGLEVVRPLLGAVDSEACAWISLVHGPRGQAGAALGMEVPALSPALGFADTAALVSTLDLVITSDTSMAHLAAGLGVPTGILLTHAADWRWGPRQGSSPWYPQARLLRQQQPGDWSGVVDAVLQALRSGWPRA